MSAKMKKAADARTDETGRVDSDQDDAIEMARVLARVAGGRSLLEAFGSPGDWGGEIEDALREAYRT